jgi:energy-coupling factor transport system substrate-specific component
MRTKDIVVLGMLSAILIAVQVALRFLPNVEMVSLLIILFTLVFGPKTIYSIYVFVLLEGTIYGFGLWWLNYLYIWLILYLITVTFRKLRSPFYWAVISGCYGLFFGALCSIPYLFIGGPAACFAYWVSGIPFDLIHCAANFLIMLVLFKPIYYILNKINRHSVRMNECI